MPGPPHFLKNRPLLAITTGHWLSQLGFGIFVTAMVTWIVLLPMHLRNGDDNPYVGLAMFVVVPAVLVAGLLLTLLGLRLGRARIAERLAANVDDRPRALRRLIVFLIVTAVVNLLIATQVTYRAVHHMESREFCASCHVMTPESTALSPGPHSALMCVDCHVGSGARGWFASKLSGTRQLWHVMAGSVTRPIPSAIESGRLVSSTETCERCHERDKLATIRLRIRRTYADDEANTPKTTVMTMHVGGARMGGIHGAHCAAGVEIRFVANDARRQEIPLVEYTNAATGEHRTYVRSDAKQAELANAPRITMQCIDCHNRPAHVFLSPERAVDRGLTLGQMSSSLPGLKKKGVELLAATYASRAEAAERIPAALTGWYREQHPQVFAARGEDVAEAGRALAEIYAHNFFPELGVDWRTYPDNGGHEASPGCFRCHKGEHTASTGETITKNCFKCHGAASVNETDPEILKALDLNRQIDAMRKK
ncbi:MAG TPA: NapC/NirT family cytochrome c [Planctomycetota bacterium]|nr:NapC/NirT family cytochrome c [Planctomycetota bacterium]